MNQERERSQNVCDDLFEQFNIGDHGLKQIRSMRVGDCVMFDEERVWICQLCSWKEM